MWNSCKTTRLNDVFPEWMSGGGIFSVLQSFQVPWRGENISGALDLIYHGDVSGDKIISPLVEKVKVGETLTELEKTVIATSIVVLCGVNWEKQWETLSFEYNPIENYSMVETMTDDETVTEYGKSTTRTDNLTHGKTGTETRTDNLTDTITPNITTNISDTVHGFNSTDGVPTGEQAGTETGTNTETHTGTEQKQYNLTDTDAGTQTILDGGSDTHTRNYELTRAGNIGVTTSQQMIESERLLWEWNFFRNVVFPDIDRVLTLSIY